MNTMTFSNSSADGNDTPFTISHFTEQVFHSNYFNSMHTQLECTYTLIVRTRTVEESMNTIAKLCEMSEKHEKSFGPYFGSTNPLRSKDRISFETFEVCPTQFNVMESDLHQNFYVFHMFHII